MRPHSQRRQAPRRFLTSRHFWPQNRRVLPHPTRAGSALPHDSQAPAGLILAANLHASQRSDTGPLAPVLNTGAPHSAHLLGSESGKSKASIRGELCVAWRGSTFPTRRDPTRLPRHVTPPAGAVVRPRASAFAWRLPCGLSSLWATRRFPRPPGRRTRRRTAGLHTRERARRYLGDSR